MKHLPFKASQEATIGTELEFQLIDPNTFGLISRARDLVHTIPEGPYQKLIKPEITQSMIEINSSIHQQPATMLPELEILHDMLLEKGKQLNIKLCGGGAHPFEPWFTQKIYPFSRFKSLTQHYRHFSKLATVFGQHVHVGCLNGDDAIYLTHALGPYVPQLIAMAAASPYYQGIDTGHHSNRANAFSIFPLSGHIPFLLNWESFSAYFYKMRQLGIINSMKDFYWDIRPKPEFGTVEIRVCDTPLTIEKAIIIAAYIQALSHYLLKVRPVEITETLYHLYGHNRFQASRYGFSGTIIHHDTLESCSIHDDILNTIELIQAHVNHFDSGKFIEALKQLVIKNENDAGIIREMAKRTESLPELVREQCKLWGD